MLATVEESPPESVEATPRVTGREEEARQVRGDRHGRSVRVDNDARRRPFDGFRVRTASRFAQLVEQAIDELPRRLALPLQDADVTVGEVPPADERPVGARLVTATPGARPRLVVFRRVLESRARDREELEDRIRYAVGEAVARALGLDDDLDDLYGED